MCIRDRYMIENRTTVRAAAKKFGVSKSTVHKDLSERLAACDRVLYGQVKATLCIRDSPRLCAPVHGHRHVNGISEKEPPLGRLA